jgi:hypothetical protein
MWQQRGKALISGVTAAAAGSMWLFFGGMAPDLQAAIPQHDAQQQAVGDMQDAYAQVATDAVQQYEMVKRSGTPVDICVRAGMTATAFLQAKKEPEYIVWKNTERTDCARAGMPKA